MGRTARAGSQGKALLFLLPSEVGFLRYLTSHRVPLNEYEFPTDKISSIQTQLESLLTKNYYLERSARDAMEGYLMSYKSHALKHVFELAKLDLAAVAKGFGFGAIPKLHAVLELTKNKQSSSFKGQKR